MAKGKTDARTPIGLKCSKCGKMTRRHTQKNTKNTTDKLEIKKYCPFVNLYKFLKKQRLVSN